MVTNESATHDSRVARYTGIDNALALLVVLFAELVPSVHRSKTEGILGVAMCLGAMLVLGTARVPITAE